MKCFWSVWSIDTKKYENHVKAWKLNSLFSGRFGTQLVYIKNVKIMWKQIIIYLFIYNGIKHIILFLTNQTISNHLQLQLIKHNDAK